MAFDRVVQNVRDLVAAGANVGLNMNVARWNLSRVEGLYGWAEELGVSYLQVRPTLVTPFPHQHPEDVLSADDVAGLLRRLRTLEQDAAQSRTKLIVSRDKFADIIAPNYGRTYKGCLAHRLFVVLNANGDLAVCMYQMTDRRFFFGNIHAQSLESIWSSEQRKEAVRFCDRELNHTVYQCQVCCKGHEINKVLDRQHGGTREYQSASSPFI